MGTWSGRSLAALALAVSVVTVGCGGGGSDAPTFPENTLEIGRTQVPMDSPADVTYAADQRWIFLTDASGSYLELAFEGQAYELPMGHFTGQSAAFVSATVCVGSSCRTYYAPDEVNGDVYVGGDEVGRALSIAGGLGLDNGSTVDEVLFSYDGAYEFGPDSGS